jgi:hypothetical protein
MQTLKAEIARHSVFALMEQPDFSVAFRELSSGNKQMQHELEVLQQSIAKSDDKDKLEKFS